MTTTRRRTLAAAVLATAVWATTVVGETPPPDRPSTDDAALVAAKAPARRVLLISIDGLNPNALRELGRQGTPALHQLVAEGASTMNARTEVEQTETLPNHIGMVTGRRIDAGKHGHGVTWNDERKKPRTVQDAAGHRVASIFSVADAHGLSGALFSAKRKFTLMGRSWVDGIDTQVIDENNTRLARTARRDLAAWDHDVTMLHISLPDAAGHEHGFMTARYLDAVRSTDRLVGRVMATVRRSASSGKTWVVLTADHGGPRNKDFHRIPDVRANYRVPFVVWGPKVQAGGDLYDLSRGLADPGKKRVGYGGEQPVRNGAAANVVTELLRLPVVPGSRLNADRALNWR